ncbi:MAG: hypothetical protein CMO81_12415 [Waddliaceae bacterium]|nr:hypothetical protein [Waddliaceae bacterium]|tara:strand:- start:349 stop:738 length:390 start_codon:yes stop_codon:yes gene_type:complete
MTMSNDPLGDLPVDLPDTPLGGGEGPMGPEDQGPSRRGGYVPGHEFDSQEKLSMDEYFEKLSKVSNDLLKEQIAKEREQDRRAKSVSSQNLENVLNSQSRQEERIEKRKERRLENSENRFRSEKTKESD